MTSKELFIIEYNKICKKHLANNSKLSDLDDYELWFWIAGQTYKYGRSIQDSFDNATLHMKNKNEAIKLFSTKKSDLLGL